MLYVFLGVVILALSALATSLLLYVWRNRRKPSVLSIVVLYLGIMVILVALAWSYHKPIQQLVQGKPQEPTLSPYRCRFNSSQVNLPRDDYHYRHRQAAKNLPNAVLIRDERHIESLMLKKKLNYVSPAEGYIIAELDHSYPVLHPKAYKVLQELGKEFREALVGDTTSAFVVSSLTRTIDQQKELTKSNRAATKKTSTHSYGASFDISRFYTTGSDCRILQKALQKVLRKKRRNQKIYICPEKACFHLTVL